MTPKTNGSQEPDPMQKLQDFARRVLAVPKKEIDREIAKEKATKKRRK